MPYALQVEMYRICLAVRNYRISFRQVFPASQFPIIAYSCIVMDGILEQHIIVYRGILRYMIVYYLVCFSTLYIIVDYSRLENKYQFFSYITVFYV